MFFRDSGQERVLLLGGGDELISLASNSFGAALDTRGGGGSACHAGLEGFELAVRDSSNFFDGVVELLGFIAGLQLLVRVNAVVDTSESFLLVSFSHGLGAWFNRGSK